MVAVVAGALARATNNQEETEAMTLVRTGSYYLVLRDGVQVGLVGKFVGRSGWWAAARGPEDTAATWNTGDRSLSSRAVAVAELTEKLENALSVA